LIAGAFSLGLVSDVEVMYSSATYRPRESNEKIEALREEAVFSQGPWTPALIPYLEGEFPAGRHRTVIASLGYYESQKARLFIRNYEPDRCIFIIPEKTPSDGPSLRALADAGPQRHRGLFEDFDAPLEDIVKCPAGDIVGVVRKLTGYAELLHDDEVFLFPLGTKPHALAFSLFALANKGPAVVPRVPARYVPMAHIPDGTAWKYTITDLSAPIGLEAAGHAALAHAP